MRQYTSRGTDPSFELDGVVFKPAEMSLLDMAQLAKFQDVDVETPQGIAALDDFFRTILGADYDKFRAHCARHHTDAETLLQIITDVLEDVVGVPSQRPSPSTTGPTATGSTYKVMHSDGSVAQFPLTEQRRAELAEAVRRSAEQVRSAAG